MSDSDATDAPYGVVPLAQLTGASRWRTESMRSYARPLLYWFTKGQGRITVQGVTAGWGPNNAVLLPPRTMHGFDVVGQAQGYALYLPDEADLGLPDQPVHLRLRDAQAQAELGGQIVAIRDELERDDSSARALHHHAGLLTLWLERKAGPLWTGEGAEPRSADSLARAYAALIERDLRLGRNVAGFAGDLGVTAAHLNRVCRQASGRSASSLLHERLTWEARRLLDETRMPVKDVAAMLGYSSAAYFTRAFQSRTGQTPTSFRRNG